MMFEQNLALTSHERVLFVESLCVRTRFPDRKSLRIFRTTEFLHGTHAAFRLARNANKRAEIDECRVVNRRVGFWNKHRCILPKRLLAGFRIDGFAKIEESCQNASSVSFDDRNRLIERETRDGVRGICSDSRKLLHLLD